MDVESEVNIKTLRHPEVRQVLKCDCGSQNWTFEELDVVLAKPEYLVVAKMEVMENAK